MEEQYEVEKILDKQVTKQGVEYLIKWKDYSKKYNCWVPADNVDAPELVIEFEENYKKLNDDEFEVEKILDRKNTANGVLYKIKWLDWSSKYNEWVPEDDLHCPNLLAEFEATRKKERVERKRKDENPNQPSERSKRSVQVGKKIKKSKISNENQDPQKIIGASELAGKLYYVFEYANGDTELIDCQNAKKLYPKVHKILSKSLF